MRHSFIQWALENERAMCVFSLWLPLPSHTMPVYCKYYWWLQHSDNFAKLFRHNEDMTCTNMTATFSLSSQVQKYCFQSALLCVCSANMQENVSGSGRRMKNNRATHVGADTCAQDLIAFTGNNDRWAQIKGKRSNVFVKLIIGWVENLKQSFKPTFFLFSSLISTSSF